MLKVAVTGNIGSGKSTVTKVFKSLGIPVFIADEEARKLYSEDEVKAEVIEHFGNEVYGKDGILNKEKLAQIIFNDQEALQTINQIIHPRTVKKYHSWLEKYADHPYTLHESAILFENNLQHHFDKIINVSAEESIRLERVLKRDNASKEIILGRMRNQMADEEKNKLADFVIKNDGELFLIPQVINIDKQLREV